MANLEERLVQWRRQCAEALGGTAETLEELEGHLRDEVGRRVQDGQSIDDAFAAATARLGNPVALASEFARAGTPAPWLPVRLAFIVLIAGAGAVAGFLLPWLGQSQGPLLAFHVAAVTLGYSITLLAGTLAACYLLARPFGVPRPDQLPGLVRATRQLAAAALVLTALGVMLGGIWAQEHWGRFWSWDAKELGGTAVVLWNGALLIVLSKRLLGDHALLMLGLVGNGIVALAWFAPVVLGAGLHAYGWSTLALPLGVFLVMHVGLACLGLVPAGALARRLRHG